MGYIMQFEEKENLKFFLHLDCDLQLVWPGEETLFI